MGGPGWSTLRGVLWPGQSPRRGQADHQSGTLTALHSKGCHLPYGRRRAPPSIVSTPCGHVHAGPAAATCPQVTPPRLAPPPPSVVFHLSGLARPAGARMEPRSPAWTVNPGGCMLVPFPADGRSDETGGVAEARQVPQAPEARRFGGGLGHRAGGRVALGGIASAGGGGR